MNDWVNCLRKVAFGQQQQQQLASGSVLGTGTGTGLGSSQTTGGQQQHQVAPMGTKAKLPAGAKGTTVAQRRQLPVDVLLEPAGSHQKQPQQQVPSSDTPTGHLLTAQQAKAAASAAAAKSRQRQPSLLGSCKPQPPVDSPFLANSTCKLQLTEALINNGQPDTLTPSVRGQLISAANCFAAKQPISLPKSHPQPTPAKAINNKSVCNNRLDEEEENMLYCSIEDNPSEHNYRVKVIETELAQRCQLKCYPLVGPATVDLQYEQLAKFQHHQQQSHELQLVVTFYQLIIGPQELTLLNDYQQQQTTSNRLQLPKQQQQQGLWSWPYQCIRRYGFDKDNCFMFEAGRKCTSGPGQFIVQTPKAYHIYQDVVKFVNELRSLNSGPKPLSSLPPILENDQPLKCQKSVTQISVSWTPQTETTTTTTTSKQPEATRSLFFDNLNRQLVPTKCDQPLPLPPPSREVKLDEQQTVAAIDREKYQDSEETDESGYDQNDDSVDSSTRSSGSLKAPSSVGAQQQHQSANGEKSQKRCHEDLSSVSSSTGESCNSSQSSGSPAQSIGKRAGQTTIPGDHQPPRPNAKQQQQYQQRQHVRSKVAQLEQLSGNHNKSISRGTSSKTLDGLQKLLEAEAAGSGQTDCPTVPIVDDFEASLIRDVYSEISKLHATFAITTSDDLSGCRGSNYEDPASEDGRDTASNPASSGGSISSTSSSPRDHPTYTNLSGRIQQQQPVEAGHRAIVATSNKRPMMGDNYWSPPSSWSSSSVPSQQQQQQHQPKQQVRGQSLRQQPPANSYDLHESLSCNNINKTMYQAISVLNPIPECGDETLTASQRSGPHPPRPMPKPMRLLPVVVPNQEYSSGSRFGQCSLGKKQTSSKQTATRGLRHNHYLINDVQYARVSRDG